MDCGVQHRGAKVLGAILSLIVIWRSMLGDGLRQKGFQRAFGACDMPITKMKIDERGCSMGLRKKFKLLEIESFMKAVETNNFKVAAEKMNISAPAFTRRIQNLENSLGVKLFERDTRNIDLTMTGREFYREVAKWIDGFDNIVLRSSEIQQRRVITISIACVPSVAYYFLPQYIGEFTAKHSNVKVNIYDASANDVLLAVSKGEVDFGINFIGNQESDLEFQSIAMDQFVLACRQDNPLARRSTIGWKELADLTLIGVGKTSGNRVLQDIELANNGISLALKFEAKHVTTVIGMVEAGMGVAAVPSLAMPSLKHPVLASVPLMEPKITRNIGLIKRRGVHLQDAANDFYDFIRNNQLHNH